MLIETIPLTISTQIFIDPHPPNTHRDRLVRLLHQACDNNRVKVEADYATRNIKTAEWTLISTRANTMPTFISTPPTAHADTPSPMSHPPPSTLDYSSQNTITELSQISNYDPTWNRHERKDTRAQPQLKALVSAMDYPPQPPSHTPTRIQKYNTQYSALASSMGLWLGTVSTLRTDDPSSTTEGHGHKTQAPPSTTAHQHGRSNAKRKRPYSTSRSKTTTQPTHTSKRMKGLTGAASAMEEGLPQDEDTLHLTTLTSHVNSTPVHTVNNTGTSGCQERTANAAMEIDSPANVHAPPATAVPHLFPVFTRSVSRRGRLDPIAIDLSSSSAVDIHTCTAADTNKSTSTLDYDKHIVDS